MSLTEEAVSSYYRLKRSDLKRLQLLFLHCISRRFQHSAACGTDTGILKDYLGASPTTLLMKEETSIALKSKLCNCKLFVSVASNSICQKVAQPVCVFAHFVCFSPILEMLPPGTLPLGLVALVNQAFYLL